MSAAENPQKMRNRTINWPEAIDVLAKTLAAQRNLPRGVSELLELLVLNEAVSPKIPIAASYGDFISHNEKLASHAEELASKVLKRSRKKG